ncbi:MAG: twin-arginine translocase subunit TatC [Bacteroidota bacterium]
MTRERNILETEGMSFLDHLEVLRWHLIRSLIAIVVFFIIAFSFPEFFFEIIILGPSKVDFISYQLLCNLIETVGLNDLCIDQLGFSIQNRKMSGQFTMHIFYSFIIGLTLAFPYTFWEIWRFVKPGLYDNEKKISNGATFFVSLLFLMGVAFGYFVVSPVAINFLGNYQIVGSIVNEIDLTSYVETVTMIVFCCGIMFQMPIVIYFLAKVGVVTPKLLVAYRKHAFVGILVVSAIITPPEPTSQILLSLPIYLLFEFSIWIAGFVVKEEEAKINYGKRIKRSEKRKYLKPPPPHIQTNDDLLPEDGEQPT